MSQVGPSRPVGHTESSQGLSRAQSPPSGQEQKVSGVAAGVIGVSQAKGVKFYGTGAPPQGVGAKRGDQLVTRNPGPLSEASASKNFQTNPGPR